MPQNVREVGALVQPLLSPLVFVLGLVLILGMGVEGRLSVSAASPAHSGTAETLVVPAMGPVCFVTAGPGGPPAPLFASSLQPQGLSCRFPCWVCRIPISASPSLQRSWLHILYAHLPHTT